MRQIIESLEAEYRRYKALADAALAQVSDEELSAPGPNGSNSLAVLVRHIAGNLESRFTDFRTSDGEKPWRDRDDEFVPRRVTREECRERWERGWGALFSALASLTDADCGATITIRGTPLRVDEALHRSLAHTAYHVGQIVYLAKALRGSDWRCLSIPLGESRTYNREPSYERAAAHADALARGAGAPGYSIQPPPTTRSSS
ncbi:MAG TPA: DUF1572 family protein [Vicinamibacterales bacterium]|nr:DUF1572 family protein [Vicinamibacterales bacterium]